jgi:hypothetical protein
LKKYTDTIMFHHEAAPSDGDSDDDDVAAIHKYHIKRGYRGIGYGYVVDDGGVIWLGRGPDYASGGTKDELGYNSHVVDICYVGDYSKDQLPDVMKEAGMRLTRDLIAYFKLPGKGGPIKYIKGHYDVDATQCPGKNFPLDEFKALLDEKPVAEKPKVEPVKTTLLKKGRKGSGVKAVQAKLIKLGYYLGGSGADGIFGTLTEKAVRDFQTDAGITVDGIVGPQTEAALDKAKPRTTTFRLGVSLKKGNRGGAVRNVQKALKAYTVPV